MKWCALLQANFSDLLLTCYRWNICGCSFACSPTAQISLLTFRYSPKETRLKRLLLKSQYYLADFNCYVYSYIYTSGRFHYSRIQPPDYIQCRLLACRRIQPHYIAFWVLSLTSRLASFVLIFKDSSEGFYRLNASCV